MGGITRYHRHASTFFVGAHAIGRSLLLARKSVASSPFFADFPLTGRSLRIQVQGRVSWPWKWRIFKTIIVIFRETSKQR